MASDDDNEKTEEATDARREEFRKQGQIAHSKELATAFLLLAVAGIVSIFGKFFHIQLQELFQATFGDNLVQEIRSGNFADLSRLVGMKIVILVFPIIILGALIGSISSVIQIGFLSVDDALSPKFERLNPVEGFGRIFSLRAIIEGLKSLLKVILVAVVIFITLKKEAANWPYLQTYSVNQLIVYMGTMITKILFGIGMVMLVLAAADYFYQFKDTLEVYDFMKGIRLNVAREQDDHSFLKLTIKVRHKIVADGLDDSTFDVTNKGIHLKAKEFNQLLEDPNTIVVDFRNHYESEIGHFKGAITPDVDTFRESLPIIEEQLKDFKEDKNT
ncbi:MAG: EscU/YscU/HrcU family type III secretion system export apparatus switch protein [Bdellovibrionaceae bacterium]|nr:EscU/YscU/HrcU family type III secretion system export apparatus switch protein [Pseudobdellovibrionaceae bacterium]